MIQVTDMKFDWGLFSVQSDKQAPLLDVQWWLTINRKNERFTRVIMNMSMLWTGCLCSPQILKQKLVLREWGAAVTDIWKCGCSFGTGQWVEAGRVLRYLLEKTCIALVRPLRVILGRAQKEKEESCKGSLSLLKGHLINPEENAGRKTDILMRSQKELRNILLERTEKHLIGK